jgi:hypothetical protein
MGSLSSAVTSYRQSAVTKSLTAFSLNPIRELTFPSLPSSAHKMHSDPFTMQFYWIFSFFSCGSTPVFKQLVVIAIMFIH